MIKDMLEAAECGNLSALQQSIDLQSCSAASIAALLTRTNAYPDCQAFVLSKIIDSLLLESSDDESKQATRISPILTEGIQIWKADFSVLKVEDNFRISDPFSLSERMGRALAAFKKGEFLVVVDAINRENEGDLIIAAELATSEKIAFMVRHTSGLICTPMTSVRADELELPLMVSPKDNTESHRTAFTISVDYKFGTSTGISAGDRSLTMNKLASSDVKPSDFVRPGHIFPLRAKDGGVLEREGHTEAGVDLCKLSGLNPVAAICEIVKPDGSMARTTELKKFAQVYGLNMISIEDLISYRKSIS